MHSKQQLNLISNAVSILRIATTQNVLPPEEPQRKLICDLTNLAIDAEAMVEKLALAIDNKL